MKRQLKREKSGRGVIYIMTNPSFKEYVKIGWAANVKHRKKELDGSTAVPFSFKIYATLEVKDRGPIRSDIYVHNLIGMLRPELRSVEKNESGKIVRQREFFQMEAEEAYELLVQIAGLTGGQLVKYEETQKDREELAIADDTRRKYGETIAARREYWKAFFEFADKDPEYLKVFRAGRKAPTDHWVDIGCGVSAGHISLTINVRQHGIAVEFYIPKNKRLYGRLLSQKERIENELGFAPEWQPLEEKDASRIIVRNELGDFRSFNDKSRQRAFEWMKEKAIVMGRVFRKYAKK